MPASGEMWKQFRLLESLGKGGMGRVFLAEDTVLDRKVALKFLPPSLEEDPVSRERFLREAKSAAALDHPYICKIYEIGELDGKAYIVMEYVSGTTLFEKVAAGPLPLPQLLDIGAELAEAVDAAHKKNIVHRDIKTGNVMVTTEGHVKILDFGLAKTVAMEASADSRVDTFSGRLTSHDSTPGTVIYMSPEQVRGENIDGRTDIFSLGVVLYEMATANLPFQGATSGLIYDAILNLGPRPPRYHNPNLPEEIERIIVKCLEKDREQRYQTAKELMVDLKRLKRDTDTNVRHEELESFRQAQSEKAKMPKRAKWGFLLGAAALLGVVGLFAWRNAVPSAPSPIDSLAVLPFENTRNDPEIEYLSEGIAETLINRLSSLPELRVMARGSSFRYRGQSQDPKGVGEALHVGAVLTGRIVQQGEQLNVQAELVDVGTGMQIWGEQYNRDIADIVAVQNDLAREISVALRPALTGAEASPLAAAVTSNSAAYQAYWKGRFYWNRRTNEDFKKAIGYFEQALQDDAGLALAHVGLADSYLLLGAQFYGPDPDNPPSAAMAKARTAAREALKIDPNLGEAHVTLAYIEFLHDWNWEAAERDFLRAIELRPKYPVAHQWYSELLMVLGRHDEAVKEARAALDLEPASPILSRELGFRYYMAGRYDEAIDQFEKTLELDPEFSLTREMLADAYWEKGMKAEALAEAERLDARKKKLYELMANGTSEEAVAWVDSYPRDAYSLTNLAGYYAQAGGKEQALRLVEEAFEKRIPQLLITLSRPRFIAWRSEPRLAEIRRSMGLDP